MNNQYEDHGLGESQKYFNSPEGKRQAERNALNMTQPNQYEDKEIDIDKIAGSVMRVNVPVTALTRTFSEAEWFNFKLAIKQLITQKQLALLDELEKDAWDFGTSDGMNVRYVIDVAAINARRKELTKGSTNAQDN